MENKVTIVLLFFAFVRIDGTLEPNLTSKTLMGEIEENHELGMDCTIYSNSIEAFINEYKQMYDSLNIACQLHLRSATDKLKNTVESMVAKKLDEYLASVDKMRSKIIKMKQYQDNFQSLQTNLNDTIRERDNLNGNIEKYKSDLSSVRANLTETIKSKRNLAEQLLNVETNLSQSSLNYQIKLRTMETNLTETLNEKSKLGQQIRKMEDSFNRSEGNLKSVKKNLTVTIAANKNLTEIIKKGDSALESSNKQLIKTLNEKNNLTENYKNNEKVFNQSILTCQNDVKSMETNLTKKIEENKENFLRQIKFLNISRKVGFDLGRQLFLKSSELERDLLIASVYNKNISNTEFVIDFLNSISDNETIIHGYRLLFDQMRKNQHVYSTTTTTIAYRVFVDFNKIYTNNKNLIHLRDKLPQSLQNFQWNQLAFVIINVKLNHAIFMCCFRLDNLRVIAIVADNIRADGHGNDLYPKSNGKYFHIKSRYEEIYLFADSNEFAYDSNRRAVFGWSKKNEAKEIGQWQLEPIEGSQNFKIKNIYWNEYLSAAEGLKHYDYYKLFTLRSGKCEDDYCKWNFLKFTGD